MEIILFLLFGGAFLIFFLLKYSSATYEKELAAELMKMGWELVSTRDLTLDESMSSPYSSLFFFKLSGFKSIQYIAVVKKGDTNRELWVKIDTIFLWVSSIQFEAKQKSNKPLTKEQWERLL